ncbi:LacI family transcriptional regulator [Pseudoxanthomonas broegbernensis]|uniref:LacI family transcriptional regulator n=1 Tax=Pseudoxanthomonas broegbernensis TaxID=83619 RepID=A0A7V8GN91_9GAMM|nr:LacI family DNA-binding transcriptional regulator [Pseudoxanthomonas broegbernensis]KAF1686955.1 LacI family transcriptional regulator [Pseudoxanthomonas broegbernensis]MBB6065439.1 LacI family transcriptional regulator [Pseudoxanthomonas broegbernensis]
MRVRIEDVAAAAGVSMKTVSRVLNHEPGVRQSTRARVMETVVALDYRPDPSARSLAGNRSYLVALLYDNPSPNYLMEIVTGVVDACEQHHYGMVMQPVAFHDPGLADTIESLVNASRLDGLILTPPLTDSQALLDRLDERGVPFSCISPRHPQGRIGVTLDEHEAVCELLAQLIGLGHRRIGHVRGHPDHGASEWRMAGYRSALRRAGLRYDPALVVDGEFSFDSGLAAGFRLLDLPSRPTAIFAANDDMAAGVMRAAAERGLRVPDDLSVCGFDNTPISQQMFPRLTTVQQPTRDMGQVATMQLLGTIRDRGAGRMVKMPYALQGRQSTGPAPAEK